jgi:TolB protein
MKRIMPALFVLAATLAVPGPALATFPGANGKLVFQRPAGDQMDLFTIHPAGGHSKRLIGGGQFEEKAEWSPDGRRIAFSRGAPGESGLPQEIWTSDAHGRRQRQLTSWNDLAGAPAWISPNRITYFTTKDFPAPSSPDEPPPPAEIYSMAADGSSQRRLTNDDVIQVDPEVSPADGTIAYIAYREVAGEPGVFDLGLFSIARDGGHPRTIARFSAKRDIVSTSWSPDGKRIVAEVAWATPRGDSGGSGRQSDLVVINADGSHLRRLTSTPALETNPVWSPDGRRIAFTSDRHAMPGDRARWSDDFELYVMRADGTHVRRLTRNSVADLVPDWQPVPRRRGSRAVAGR